MKTAILLFAGVLLTAAAPVRASAQATAAAVDTARVYRAEEVTRVPDLTNRATIARALQRSYPREFRNAARSGSASIRVVVGRDGIPEAVTVQRADEPEFGAAGVEVLRRARFTPALLNGVPVRVWVVIPLTFELHPMEPPMRPEPRRANVP